MAGWSTLAKVAVGIATAGTYTGPSDPEDATRSKGPRTPSDDAVFTGKAKTREQANLENATVSGAPDESANNSGNYLSAYAAGERARKRAAAGASVLTGAQQGAPGPAGGIAVRTLIGS